MELAIKLTTTMKLRGIGFKLTVWYALAFSIAGSIIFLSFYLLTKQALYYQTDAALSTHGQKVMEVALRRGADMHDELAKQAFLDEFAKIPGMLIVIGDNKGEIIGSSAVYGNDNETIVALVKEVVKSNQPAFFSRRVGALILRFWTQSISKDGQTIGVILVAHPIEIIEKSLADLVSAMSIVYVGLVILTTFGGYLLSRKATAPVRELTEKITRITAENLDERVMVRRTGDEIEELSTTFNGLLDRLDRAFRRERQFIGDLAHELKTPLATLRGEIELALARKRGAAQYRRALGESLTDAKRLSETLANILDLAWSKTDTQMEKVNLSSLMSDLAEVAEKMAGLKKIRVKHNIAKRTFVLGKRDKLSRAILNLIDNAVKFSPNKGEVIIYLGKEKGGAVVKISDNGEGIKKADKPHIFNRFYRGKNTGTTGSGLGLPIALAIVTAHQGRLSITSKRGGGTTATIYLPQYNKLDKG